MTFGDTQKLLRLWSFKTILREICQLSSVRIANTKPMEMNCSAASAAQR